MGKRKFRSKDLSLSDLPHNRREQFLWLIKTRYITFVKTGACFLLFAVVLLLVSVFGDLSVINVYEHCEIEGLDAASTASAVYGARSFYLAVTIPAAMLFSVALAGASRVFLRMVFDESVFFTSDFKDGVKASGLSFSVNALIIGASVFACDYFANFTSLPPFATGTLYAILAFVVIPVCFFSAMQSTLYKTDLTGLIKNSFILYFKSALTAIPMFILCAIPLLSLLINDLIVKYIVIVLEIFIVLPYVCAALSLWCQSVFDKHINKRQYPEIYLKGLN
ncbi:MAG: hypothetical protein J5762_00480 [Clostridia bacterium]|nr:hypothetical protein [Clostridia bacterium]